MLSEAQLSQQWNMIGFFCTLLSLVFPNGFRDSGEDCLFVRSPCLQRRIPLFAGYLCGSALVYLGHCYCLGFVLWLFASLLTCRLSTVVFSQDVLFRPNWFEASHVILLRFPLGVRRKFERFKYFWWSSIKRFAEFLCRSGDEVNSGKSFLNSVNKLTF